MVGYINRGLHYDQDFSHGEFHIWMEKMTWLSTYQHFLQE